VVTLWGKKRGDDKEILEKKRPKARSAGSAGVGSVFGSFGVGEWKGRLVGVLMLRRTVIGVGKKRTWWGG